MEESLEYKKLILSKVSFDEEIFEKELVKALKPMVPERRFELLEWCKSNFTKLNHKVIRKFLPKVLRKSLHYCRIKLPRS